MLPRVITPADVAVPSGGSLYNERIAEQWQVEVEHLPGAWPYPSDEDLRRLHHSVVGDASELSGPILLDGLIGCAAPRVLHAAAAARVRVVLLVHLPLPAETGLSAGQATDLARSERRALGAAAAIACTSQWAAADLMRRYDLGPATVAEPGVLTAPLAPGSAPPLLFTPAAFTARKNHRFLLDALGDPLLRDLDFTAWWTGAEPVSGAQDALRGQVCAAGLADRITIEAAVTGAELDALYARSNLVVLPSVAETYAMVLGEGFARGIPALVGAETGAAATLRGRNEPDSETPGVAVPLTDPHAWAEALHTWLTDDRVRISWRDAAVRRRHHLPSWAAAAQALMRVMQGGGS